MNSIESLQNRGKGAAVTRKHGYKINTASIEAQHAAEEMMLQIENDMKNASAKLAAEQAERMVKDSIAASMERIKNENESMRTWEENMVRRSGYTVDGKNIYRDAVVDSTIGKTYYEGQSVHYYEDFYNAGPTISVSLSKTMLDGLNSSAIMLLVEQANYDIENWSKQVFGNTEKDEEGNVVLKQNALAREASYDNDIERYKALSKKDYDKLSEDEQKEFNKLSTGIVSVRDGALGEWTGYAPVFKDGNSGLDLSNSRESNIKYQGSGQMGQIMLDFQWNCMIEQQGWQKVALPAYDQPLWRGNGSWFEPPTIRGVASIVFEIVGQASSQTWFSYADDVIFAAIDLGGGFKSPEQVGLDLAKTAATAVISMGCSSAGSAIGNIAGKAMEGASKFANFAAQAGISAATTYVSTVATSAVSSVYIGADGNLAFDGEGFGKSTYSASTIAGALGAGFTAGLNEIALGTRYDKVKDPDTGKMKKEYTHTRATGLSSVNAANIQALNGLAGGLLTNAIEYAVDGQTTFNLLNSSLFGVGSVGMLEFTIGKEGVKSKFGMGGTNISVNNLINSMIGAKDWNTSEKITKYAEGMDSLSADDKKKLANALRANYGFGDKKQLENLDEILKGETELRKDGTDGKAQTIVDADSHKTIMMALSEGMDWKELGLLIGHEAYRDGVVGTDEEQFYETMDAVFGHTTMALRMTSDSLYTRQMNSLIANNENISKDVDAFKNLVQTGDTAKYMGYIGTNYDYSSDYWLFKLDGSIVDDGKTSFNREVINVNGKIVSEKMFDFSDGYNSKAEELVKAMGLDKVEKMLGRSLNSFDDIDDKVLVSIYGEEKAAAIRELKETNPDEYARQFENNKLKIYGEALLIENHQVYNNDTHKWEQSKDVSHITNQDLAKMMGMSLYDFEKKIPSAVQNSIHQWSYQSLNKLKIPGLDFNDSLGVSYDKDSKQMTFFTLGMEFDRKNYDIGKIGNEATSTRSLVDNTDVTIKYKDLFNEANNVERTLAEVLGKDVGFTTVDKLSTDDNCKKGDISYHENTIVSEYFKMHLITDLNYTVKGLNTYGVLTDAYTLNGRYVKKDGRTKPGEARWLFHGFGQPGGSEGCYGIISDVGVGGNNAAGKPVWSDKDYEGSGTYYVNQLFKYLANNYHLYAGYEINMHNKGLLRP